MKVIRLILIWILFQQQRYGQNGEVFTMYKIRTMRVGAKIVSEEIPDNEDLRITWWGHWLRRFCLDEVPQFINVFRNEIGLIGTRPEIAHPLKIGRYTSRGWKTKKALPHGLTGVWQVFLKGGLHIFEDDAIELEAAYYNSAKRTIWSDLEIIFLTPVRMIRGVNLVLALPGITQAVKELRQAISLQTQKHPILNQLRGEAI